jgi:Arc/MetJ-type ribon-helix-helix transcriptional regulator
MKIRLPEDVENAIQAEILSGHFASEEDLVAVAVRDYLRRRQEQTPPPRPAASYAPAAPVQKPVWERILERTAAIPDKEWDKLPTDLAEQHDHYLYGTPKRPPA